MTDEEIVALIDDPEASIGAIIRAVNHATDDQQSWIFDDMRARWALTEDTMWRSLLRKFGQATD